MDFHSLPRRDLQALCKKNSIPANMTNVAMADALQALHSAERLEFSSPAKAEPRSPPKTGRRTSTRLSARPAPPQGSPMPRSRRVTAKAPGALRLDDGNEEEEKATVTTRRRGRESLKKGSEDGGAVTVGSAVGRRSTRGKAIVKKMADLGNEEEEIKCVKECDEQEQEEKEMVEAPSDESTVDVAVPIEQVVNEVEQEQEQEQEENKCDKECDEQEQEEKEMVEAPSDESTVDDLKFSVAVSIEQVVNEVEAVVGEENNVEIVGTPNNCPNGGEVERSSGETADDLLPRMQTLTISVEAPEHVSIDMCVESRDLDSSKDNLVIDDASKESEEVLAFEAMKESDEANNVDCHDDISIDMCVEGLDSGSDNHVNNNASMESEEVLALEAMKESGDHVNNNASKEPEEVAAFEAVKKSDETNNVECDKDDASKEPEEVLAFEAMKVSDEINNVECDNDTVNDDAWKEREEVIFADNVECDDDTVNDDASKEPEVLAFEAMKVSDEINNVECNNDTVNDDAWKEREEVIFADNLTLATTEESEEANNVNCVDDHVINSSEVITSLRTNNDNSNKENVSEEGKRLPMMMGLGKADFGNMSLRKLRAMYKDVKIKEGEEKRSALTALDENCLSRI